jgi:plastocyanin
MAAARNLKLGMLLFIAVFGLSAAGLYAGAELVDESEQASAGEGELDGPPGGPVSVRIVAKDLKFDKRSIAASPGVPVTVTLDNQDPGTLHNIAFYTNNRATQAIHTGDLFAGPLVREFQFSAPGTPGNFYFRCDAHPDTMNGTFSVK